MVLAWTGLLYVASWLSSYVTFAQLKLTGALGLPAMALQVSVPIILGWAVVIRRQAETAEQLTTAAPMGAVVVELATVI